MNKILGKYIIKILPSFINAYIRDQVRSDYPAFKRGVIFLLRDMLSFKRKNRIVSDNGKDFYTVSLSQASIIESIDFGVSTYYIYPLDTHLIRIPKYQEIASLTPDYAYVLNLSLSVIKEKLSGCSEFERGMSSLISSIEDLGIKIRDHLELSNNPRKGELLSMFPDILYRSVETFDEALQKILFYNALLWQNRLWHNGLGRLDKILYGYYKKDLSDGRLTRTEAKDMLRNFVLLLKRDTESKSYSLLGDTGQVILLGGIDKEGHEVSNELTEIILELFSELKIPDPKLILRVNCHTPENVWKLSAKCLITGCGSPLLMNEDLIIPLMERFGYAPEDCPEMGTSSCWEPLIIGKSFDQNNPVASINPLLPLRQMLKGNYTDFDSFLNDYLTRLKHLVLNRSTSIQFDKSPLLSLLFESCMEKKRDISEGGAIYSFHGMQVVGFPNLVNSLLNIKTFVFEKKLLTLEACRKVLKRNYQGAEDVRVLFLENPLKFGSSNDFVVVLSNRLSDCVSEAIKKVRLNDCPVKVGFSSPSYIGQGRSFPATLDGRRAGEPFATHISPVSKDIDLPEILRFASLLDYSGNRLNGNVVDFTIPEIFRKDPSKLVSLLKNSIEKGVYEIQLNVLDVDQLREAKAHPDKYPDLIVRVWGFSAYFNDLPEDYKDNLIRRAEAYA